MSNSSYSHKQMEYLFRRANKNGSIRAVWYNELNPEYVANINKLRELLKSDADDNDKQEYIEKCESQLKGMCDAILNKILKSDYSMSFQEKPFIYDNNKKMYCHSDVFSFFADQAICDELRKVYKVKFGNRNSILECLLNLLKEESNKIIIRGDIKGFFENISNSKMITKLEDEALVSPKSLKILRRLFFKLAHDNNLNGLPRGMGLSSYLSEIYLRDADKKVKNLSGVFFYKRYVDDIFLIATPCSKYPDADFLYAAVEEIFKEERLVLHTKDDSKKYISEYVMSSPIKDINFDYLGYNITIQKDTNNVVCCLTDAKVGEYKDIIDKAIDNYVSHAQIKPKDRNYRHQPLRIFNLILKYLTRNYHLGGTKHDILSGIYNKHPYLNDYSQLHALDDYLAKQLNKKIKPNAFSRNFLLHAAKFGNKDFCTGLIAYIRRHYSFYKGYVNHKMCKMTSQDLRIIKGIIS